MNCTNINYCIDYIGKCLYNRNYKPIKPMEVRKHESSNQQQRTESRNEHQGS